ncbi:hypothetical protein CY34DRAFT_641354 [Suillus luteus UH-Slu-Lm8-n1]|uniref:Uncharacterized protein n=1 Tax=Suillus luteus UH-Slu-Lm8-n1 TaxID=930992 RepID=A0A0D0B2R1_9AGAM|nr:hypothetical protein CY34DRAFT_641354 [Suillus luteus UH-Slu-Lm8-n1]
MHIKCPFGRLRGQGFGSVVAKRFEIHPPRSAQARLGLRTYGLTREVPSEYLDICPDASGLKPVLIDQSCHVKATPTDKSLG